MGKNGKACWRNKGAMVDWELKDGIIKFLEEHREVNGIAKLWRQLIRFGYDYDYDEVRKAVHELEEEGLIRLERRGRHYKIVLAEPKKAINKEALKEATAMPEELMEIRNKVIEEMQKIMAKIKRATMIVILITIAVNVIGFLYNTLFGFGVLTGTLTYLLLSLWSRRYYKLLERLSMLEMLRQKPELAVLVPMSIVVGQLVDYMAKEMETEKKQ